MSETVQYPSTTTLVTDTINTGNIAVNLDTLKQWAYLTPSTANASTILAGIQRIVNTYGPSVPFWSNLVSTSNYTQVAVPNNAGGTGGNGGWSDACLLPDGRAIIVPQIPTVTSMGIFNPVTNAFTTIATGSGVGTGYTYGASAGISPDGRVIFPPFRTTAIGIYNPVLNTFTTTTGGLTANPGHTGGCVLPNGQMMFAPYDSGWIGLFNPVTNVYTTGPTIPGYATNMMALCVPLPDGRVVLPPSTGTSATSYVGVYNYLTNTVTTTSFPNLSQSYFGANLLPDGTVAFIPFSVSNIGIYNPNTNSFTTVPITSTGFFGGKLLPNGNLFLNPYNTNYYGIYNYLTRSFTTGPANGAGTGGNCQGSCMLLDGRIILPPFVNSSNMGIYSGLTTPPPREFALHPLFNR
jgi:hypothetical protein